MTSKWMPPNLDDLIKRYRSGQSVKSLAEYYGVGRYQITGHVRDLPDYRGRGDANRLMLSTRTPEQRKAWTEAAHEARRGQRDTLETKLQRARTRERDLLHISDLETRLASLLLDQGLTVEQQKAIGPYNCDLAADPVAMEVFGGHWHASGDHFKRFPKRARYFLDQGWLLAIVWITGYAPMQPALADYLVSLVKEARADPSLRGQYRVVWGTGKDCTRPGLDLDQLARVPPRDRGDSLRA